MKSFGDKASTALDALSKDINAITFEAANAVAVEAQISITTAGRSGRVYDHYFATINGRAVPVEKRPSPHQASAPGEVPADDSGDLANRIETQNVAPLKSEVLSTATHSNFLEFGTSKMEARPFLRPAREKMREPVKRLAAQRINQALRRHFGAK